MSDVDPFLIPIPSQFLKGSTPEEIETAEYFRYLHRHLHDMWLRSGGATDNLDEVVGVIGGDPGAELPGGEDPVWDEEQWQAFASP